ncbi:MAG: hypothetical protein SGBAC_010660 [Bacillariaceae sp.]
MAEPYLWPVEDEDDDEARNSLSISVKQNLLSIAAGAFQEFLRLQQVHLPMGLQMIGLESFKGCLALSEINFPSSLIQIQDEAFAGCVSLKEARFVDGLQLLGSEAFCGCHTLTTAILPSTLDYLGTTVFSQCYRLSCLDLNCNLLEVIPEDAFENCSALTHVKLPKSIQVIERSAFMNCLCLGSIELSKKLEEISAHAFYNCATLVSLELPEGLEELDPAALLKCSSLKNLRLLQPDYFEDGSDIQDFHQEWDCLSEVVIPAFMSDIDDALYHRFDDLPVHKLCYHQIHYESEDEVWHKFDTLKASGTFGSGTREDVLGMTPLHILALSAKPHCSLFGTMLHEYPLEMVLRTDVWAKTCIDYLILNKTPNPKPSLLKLAFELMNQVPLPAARRTKIQEMLQQDLDSNPIKHRKRLKAVFYQLALGHKIENMCTLELALWKAALKNQNNTSLAKRIKMDRQEVRISYCGADVVLSNVLQYMDAIEK